MVPGLEVSYTELKFDEATATGLPRLVFLLSGTADVPASYESASGRVLAMPTGFR
jgi:hypothetical protein